MYKGPMAEGPGLGGAAPAKAPPVQPPAPPEAAQPAAGAAHNALSVYVDDTPRARNEAWARLHADPMLMVRNSSQRCDLRQPHCLTQLLPHDPSLRSSSKNRHS